MTDEEQSRSAPVKPVGRQLRQAREQLGLDVEAIADHQHLRSSIIEAIEAGDYSKVDTELFLKGYVRSYAVQVGLDADSVIRDLDAELEPMREEREREHQADPLVDIERRKRRKKQIAKAVIVVLLLGTAGVLTFNSLENEGGETPSPATENSEAPSAEGNEGSPEGDGQDAEEPASQDAAGQQEPLSEVPTETQADEALAPEADGQIAVGDSPDPITTGESSPAPEGQVASVEQSQTEASAVPGGESFSAVVDNGTAEVAVDDSAAGESSLTMTFSANCWIRITDAEGNRLVSALRGPGDELNVSGTAPFSLVVGAMSAVDTVELGGQPVDLGGFRVVNDRAEFTLEP